MTFHKMCKLEPGLRRLEQSARFAGSHGASWLDVLMATNEALTKCAGRGAFNERLQSTACYETARAALFAAWSRGQKAGGGEPKPTPDHPGTYPWRMGFDDGAGQGTFLISASNTDDQIPQ